MLTNPKILIVDDEPRMCESLRLLLADQGYEICTANSGREALKLISRDAFDLALLDIVIPDMDGHQLMDHIYSQRPDTYIIIITGHASLDSAVIALRKGAYDYLRKPFEYEELLKTVQNALTQKRLKTEKELINGKLEVTQERYRYLVENSPDIIYTLDAEGNFTFISNAAERLLGFKPEELLGMHYSTIIYEEDQKKAKWFFNERRTGARAAAGVELRLKVQRNDPEGENGQLPYVTVELKSTGMWDNDTQSPDKTYIGTHGVARDISERKRLEAQLHQAQKMEAVGTLAGGIAHDFNNLLMAIQGYTSLMLLGIDSSHPHYEKLKSIEKYVQSGAELTKQLLGFARGGKYDVKPVDVNSLLSQTSQMFARTKKEIIVHCNLQDDLWPVEGDRGQLEQVFLNLYVNAWQAMPGGGTLSISTKNLDLTNALQRPYNLPPGRYVRIFVSDTGVGMDDKTQERIFEPFFTTKKMGRGTGLGLASVYGIVKNHNGAIEVKSQKGQGTTFIIYLPASQKELKLSKETQEEILEGPETILFVDDEEMILEVGSEILKAMGYEVFSAKSGREAVQIYQELNGKVDLVILDMIMPGMSGGQTYDKLKEIDPSVKVLLSSGYSIDGEASEILKRGCNGFIQKPFNIKALSSKLREILDGQTC